mmetsp:Transcript_16585/g.42588  ORF Transcript_16585/g.42588 Transcript_16585/m.42588 type:complete len:200 (+) Transcript_16585:222-821(+)
MSMSARGPLAASASVLGSFSCLAECSSRRLSDSIAATLSLPNVRERSSSSASIASTSTTSSTTSSITSSITRSTSLPWLRMASRAAAIAASSSASSAALASAFVSASSFAATSPAGARVTPPSSILPRSACHACSTRTPRISPESTPAWIAAPSATACIGSTVRRGSTPKRLLTSLRTPTICVPPPTSTISSTGAPLGR